MILAGTKECLAWQGPTRTLVASKSFWRRVAR
jgi:hypothetical protein